MEHDACPLSTASHSDLRTSPPTLRWKILVCWGECTTTIREAAGFSYRPAAEGNVLELSPEATHTPSIACSID